jgi:hypothetical protein
MAKTSDNPASFRLYERVRLTTELPELPAGLEGRVVGFRRELPRGPMVYTVAFGPTTTSLPSDCLGAGEVRPSQHPARIPFAA